MANEDRLFPSFGVLNSIEDNRIGKTLDTRNTSPFDILKQAALEVFKRNSFEHSGPLKGIVLRIDSNPTVSEPDSWIRKIFKTDRPYTLKVLKVRIPEIHASLPEPLAYGDNALESHKVIDMHPSFVAVNEEVSNKPVAPGDVVLVDFVDRINLSQPIYLGPILYNATPGAVGQKSSQQIFNNNPNNKLAVSPPIGDSLSGTKDINNQIPKPIDVENKENILVSLLASLIPDSLLNKASGPLTEEQLKKIMPQATSNNIKRYLPALNNAMKKFEINTVKRKAAFLSQIAVESAQLQFDTELPSNANGFDFSKYDGRKDLGNTQPGDGPKYKGRGLLQLTGRHNYEVMTKKLNNIGVNVNLVEHPELAARPDISTFIAGQYFKDHNLNKLADNGDIVGVTRGVNGGTNGLSQRISFYNKALTVLV